MAYGPTLRRSRLSAGTTVGFSPPPAETFDRSPEPRPTTAASDSMEPGSGGGGPRLGLAIPGIAEAGKAEHRYRRRPRGGSGNRASALDVVDKAKLQRARAKSQCATQRTDPPDRARLTAGFISLTNAVPHAAFGRRGRFASLKPVDRRRRRKSRFQAKGEIFYARRFGQNAKFFCAQVARASAASGGGPEGQLGRSPSSARPTAALALALAAARR